jgi:hypothetical protein
VAPETAPGAESIPGELEPSPQGLAESAGQEPSFTGPMPTLSGGLGAVAASSTAAPTMIGDFFGAGFAYGIPAPPSPLSEGATVAIAGGDRIMKFAENNSPLPMNRFYFNYNNFNNAVVDVNGQSQDANRFTFGMERTFWDGWASFDLRVPFLASIDAQQTVGEQDTMAAEFGNIGLALKVLALQRGPWAVGGGLGVIFPTAADSEVLDSSGETAIDVSNDAYYLQPFIGVYCRPNNRFFTQMITAVNFDVTGTYVNVSNPNFFGDVGADRVYAQSLLFLDYSAGYWLYQSKRCDNIITGFAPMIELHYTSTLQELDVPNIGSSSDVFERDFRRDALNMTGGLLFQMGSQTSLRVAGVAPLRNDGLMFDSEFGLQLIRRY